MVQNNYSPIIAIIGAIASERLSRLLKTNKTMRIQQIANIMPKDTAKKRQSIEGKIYRYN